jgi:hypothetical protein
MAAERRPRKRPDPGLETREAGGWVDKALRITPAELHAAHVRQHLEGGAPPTTAAYANALTQWRQMPGAVSASAADCGEVPPARAHDDPHTPE